MNFPFKASVNWVLRLVFSSNAVILIIIIITLITFGKITKTINDNIEKNFKSDYLKYGFLSRYYLANNLTPLEFEDFCKYILKNIGYKNLENFSESFEGGINLCSTSKNTRIYISAKLYGLIKNEDEDEAKEYVKTLPKDYSIILLDGISLTNKLRNVRRKEIMTRIACDTAN